MKRRILGLVLAVAMLISVFPIGLISANAVTETGTSQYPFLASSYEELKELVYYAEADHSSATRHIKLVNDIYQEDTLNLNGITPSFYADIVLDLAGHSITRKSNVTTDEGVITLMAGKLTIKDSVGTGSVVSQGEIDAALYMASSSTLVINGGTFIGVTYALISQGGTLIINDGDFKCSDNGWYTIYANYEPDIIINGGRFHRTANPKFPDTNRSMYLVHTGNIMINGGYFEGGIILAASKRVCEHVSSSIVKINGVDTDISQNTTHGLGNGTDLVEVSPKSLISFKSINPAPDSAQKESGYSYLGQFLLGSEDTNINFYAFPNALSESYTEMGWTVGRDITVYHQNVQYYYREYAANEVFGWNLKNNISSGGTYKIACRIYAEVDGVLIAEKTHVFQVDIFGSSIDNVSVDIEPPIAGAEPNTTAKSEGTGYSIGWVDWSYYDEDADDWYAMPDGSVFEAGERYECSIRINASEGYSFPSDVKEMSAYINGLPVEISKTNYSTSRFYLTYEFTASEHIMIGDIPLLKGQYLVEGAVAPTYDFPSNPSDGYIYYGETLYMFNYSNQSETLKFFSDSLEIEVQGFCTIGSIYDGSYPVGTSLGIIPGDLTVSFKNGSTLDVYGSAYDNYACIRIYGNLLAQGEGQFSMNTYGGVHGPAVAMLKTLTVDGPRVVMYGTNNYALFGNDVSVSVKNGKLALWGVTNSFMNCTFNGGEIHVHTNALASIDSCTPWDGSTDLKTYKTVWVFPSQYQLGDTNLNGNMDTMDYILLKRAYFGTYTLAEPSVSDTNGNDRFDTMDYILLKRVYFGTFKTTDIG